MANDKMTVGDFCRSRVRESSINLPDVEATDFDLTNLAFAVKQHQFGGEVSENANEHLVDFLEFCETVKISGMTNDDIRLRIFPLSLRDKARSWLYSLPLKSINTWDDLAQKFLDRYCPLSRVHHNRKKISSFAQNEGESLYDAWERFKELLWLCPNHGFPRWMTLEFFFDGLTVDTQEQLDSSVGRFIRSRSTDSAHNLIDEISLEEQLELPRACSSNRVFENYGSVNYLCQDTTQGEVEFIDNSGWKSGPNFSYGNNELVVPQVSNMRTHNLHRPNCETLLESMIQHQKEQAEMIQQLTSKLDGLVAQNKMLESRISQQATFSSNPIMRFSYQENLS